MYQQAQRDLSNAPRAPHTQHNTSSSTATSSVVQAHTYQTQASTIQKTNEPLDIEQLLLNNGPPPDPLSINLPSWEPTKCSVRENGIIAGYAANTNQGIIRDYNEDRVSIVLNIMQPSSKKDIK